MWNVEAQIVVIQVDESNGKATEERTQKERLAQQSLVKLHRIVILE